MRKHVITWWIDNHPVTGDPRISGDINRAIFEWGGTIKATISKGTLIVRGWDANTPHTDDPDYYSSTQGDVPLLHLGDSLDEAIRFIVGSAIIDRSRR